MTPEEVDSRIKAMLLAHNVNPEDFPRFDATPDNGAGIPPGTYALGANGRYQIETYCCAMRKHFYLGIVGTRPGADAPAEAVNFIHSWEPGKQIVYTIKFCPFCGTELTDDQTRIAR